MARHRSIAAGFGRASTAISGWRHLGRLASETWSARGNLSVGVHRLLAGSDALTYELGVGKKTVCFTADPVLVRQILVDEAAACPKTRWEERVLEPVMEGGLIILEGADWKSHRQAIAPAFAPRFLRGLPGIARRVTRRRIDAFSRRFGVSYEMRCIVNETVVSYFTGREFDSSCGEELSLDEFACRYGKIEECLEDRVVDPLNLRDRLKRMLGDRPTFAQSIGDVTRALTAMLAGRCPMSAGRVFEDALADERSRIRELRTLVGAGATTGHLLSWILYLFSVYPDAQERSRAEFAGASRDGSEWMPENLPFVSAVVSEALRLFPPAPFLLRKREGRDLVFVCIRSMHRHPAFWEDGESFVPGRWLGRPLNEEAYIPFGLGPRVCVGKRFAHVEAINILGEILMDGRVLADRNLAPLEKSAILTRPSKELYLGYEKISRTESSLAAA